MPTTPARPRSTVPVAILLLALPFVAAADQADAAEPPPRPSAADLFEQTLAVEGLDAAVARLAAAIADTTEPYTVDPYALALGLPARLVVRHQRAEALALLQTLEPLFGDNPRYWQELGLAHLRCGNTDEARATLGRARDAGGNRPDLAWMVEHLDELIEVARRQVALEDRLVPGESTGLHGPYLGQTPPGRVPEVFALGT